MSTEGAASDGADSSRPAPRVSVVIPAYNAAPYVAESIRSALDQHGAELEVIVVDDGSTDGTAEVVATIDDPRLRCVRKENRGTASDARNAGIAESRGELVAFLDADDVWLPGKLARQLALFDARPELVLVYSAYAIVARDLTVQTIIFPDDEDVRFERWLLLEGNGIAPSSTAVIRRSAIDRTGGFRLDLSVGEDLEFVERIARLGPVAHVPECLVLYRTHGGQRHLALDEFERGMTWIFADRFGVDGALDRVRWRRGMANLNTRLFVYRLSERQLLRAVPHLGHALRLGPTRVLALPVEALRRRASRRRRFAELRHSLPTGATGESRP